MIRLAVTFALCITVGRWMYAEIATSAPGLAPAVDYLLEITAIPTHDTWDQEKIDGVMESLGEVKAAFAGDRSESGSRKRPGLFEQVAFQRDYDRF